MKRYISLTAGFLNVEYFVSLLRSTPYEQKQGAELRHICRKSTANKLALHFLTIAKAMSLITFPFLQRALPPARILRTYGVLLITLAVVQNPVSGALRCNLRGYRELRYQRNPRFAGRRGWCIL